MATLISAASGPLTGATTFALAEATSLSPVRNLTQANLFTTAVTSAAFAMSATTITGVVLFLKNLNASPTGTLTVELLKSGVVQGTCVVNKSDLAPFNNLTGILYNEPHFFKFNADVTGDATVTWTLRISASNSTSIGYTTASSLATNFTRIFRTATLQAPAASDNLYVLGEVVSQANPSRLYVVSMDSTVNTTYGSGVVNSTTAPGGGIHIGKLGALTYPTTENTNTILRIAGDLTLWEGGIFRIGSPANPIPATSTAILEFQPTSVTGDMGFINSEGGTLTVKGSPRTDGKLVTAAKLVGGTFTADYVAGTSTLTNVSDMSAAGVGQMVVGPGIPAGTVMGAQNVAGRRISISNAPTISATASPVYTYHAAGVKRLNVDADTGWLLNDVVAIAPSGTNVAEGEIAYLTANAGTNFLSISGNIAAATTLNSTPSGTQGLLYNHDGGNLAFCEIALLTRNVKIRSTSTSLMSYITIGNTVNPTNALFLYAEFVGMGANVNTKAGINFAGTAGSGVDIENCSFHSCLSTAICINPGASGVVSSWTVMNNVFWNTAATSGGALTLNGTVTDSSWVITGNVSIRNISGAGFTLLDVNGTFNNNIASGAFTSGIIASDPTTNATFLSFVGNVGHSNNLYGISFTTSISGTMTSNYGNRNIQYGIQLPPGSGVIIDQFFAFGNVLGGMALNASGFDGVIKNSAVGSDYSFNQPTGLRTTVAGAALLGFMDNCDFGASGPFLTPTSFGAHTVADINILQNNLSADFVLRNCRLASPVSDLNGAILMTPGSVIACSRYQGLPGVHVNWTRTAYRRTDSSQFNIASPSERVSPTGGMTFTGSTVAGSPTISAVNVFDGLYVGAYLYSASIPSGSYIVSLNRVARTVTCSNNWTVTSGSRTIAIIEKAESGSKYIPVDAGGTANVSVAIRLGSNADGSVTYNGNPPRLVQKANPAIGIANDIVLATYNGNPGVWGTLTATTVAPNDDGFVEVVVDCDCFLASGAYSTVYAINVDDWAVS